MSTRRVLADDERDRAVRVHMVGTVLRVVFQNENCRVIPVGAVRNGVNHAAEREVVVGYGGCRARQIRSRASGVIIRQIKKNESRQLEVRTFMRVAGAYVRGEFIQKFIGAKLV